MTAAAEIQHASSDENIPGDNLLQHWCAAVLTAMGQSGEVVIRVVDEAESQQLNHQYRHKNAATNVLSFPFEKPDFPAEQEEENYLGDLVICAPVVYRESQQQGKPLAWHWAHMVVHGMLHLLGYDHIEDTDAEEMEQQEISILQQLGIDNPYESDN